MWKDYGYLIDPHTAVAYHVMEDYRKATGDDRTTVFVPTASPFKFCDSVLHSLGWTRWKRAWALWTSWRKSPAGWPLCPWPLRDKAVRFTESVDKGQMMDVVLEMLR